MPQIPFNLPFIPPNAESNLIDALKSLKHCGNHKWCMSTIELLKEKFGFLEVFLTPSGTAALEMGAILANLGPGDEVIMPSYTFSSTANSVLLQGAKPVFCEIDPDTMNIDVNQIQHLITKNTKMILPIDYAGIPCDIDSINQIAKSNNLMVMVDSAQSLSSQYGDGRFCGNVSQLAAFSFHETKNFSCGEGGALIVNDPELIDRAHFIQEKGTDRSLVLSGVKNKYGWVDKGSSFLLSDILAAILHSQIMQSEEILDMRKSIYLAYQNLFLEYQDAKFLSIPKITNGSKSNYHAFFVIFDTEQNRDLFLKSLRDLNVSAYIGYVPLHSSSMGIKLGNRPEDLALTEDISKRIVRMPLYAQLAEGESLRYLIGSIESVLKKMYPKSSTIQKNF